MLPAWKAGLCIRSSNRRYAWCWFRTNLSCSSDRRFHQISLPGLCLTCKLLNRLYFLCGLTVLIAPLFPFHPIKNGSLLTFRLPQKIMLLSAPFFYVRLLNSYFSSYFGRAMAILSVLLSSLAQRYPSPAKFAHNNEDCLGSLLIIVNCVRCVLICLFISFFFIRRRIMILRCSPPLCNYLSA